ncbi:MAG: hypothetical protein M0Z66_05490 [Thermaerobacter sp.]|nr:hypothetical protein [Thermaerobacter sp.]
MSGLVIHAHRERTPAWRAAWDALDEIERTALGAVAQANSRAAVQIVDAVQMARRCMMDAIR